MILSGIRCAPPARIQYPRMASCIWKALLLAKGKVSNFHWFCPFYLSNLSSMFLLQIVLKSNVRKYNQAAIKKEKLKSYKQAKANINKSELKCIYRPDITPCLNRNVTYTSASPPKVGTLWTVWVLSQRITRDWQNFGTPPCLAQTEAPSAGAKSASNGVFPIVLRNRLTKSWFVTPQMKV